MKKLLQSLLKGAITEAITTILVQAIERGYISKPQYDALAKVANEFGYDVKPLKA